MSTPQGWTGPEVLAPSPPALIDLRDATTPPLTALSIVEAVGTDIGRSLASIGALELAREHLARAGKELQDEAADELTQLARGFLTIDVGTALLDGLLKAEELVEAGRTTSHSPATVLVDLAGHRLSLSRAPAVDVMLLRKVVVTVPFAVALDLTVKALIGTVKGGALVALSTGVVDAVVTFGACGAQLASTQHTFDPHLHIGLGRGVAIPFSGSSAPTPEVNPGGAQLG